MKISKPSRVPAGSRFLTASDVMQRFQISRFTLRNWLKNEDLGFPKPVSIERRRYFREIDVFKWELRQEGVDPDAISEVNGLRAASGLITDYETFVAAMAKRRQDLKLSVLELDARSGLQEGYTSKLENYHRDYGRGVGPDTMPLWLGGLKLGIVLVELPKATRNFKDLARPAIGSD